MRFVSGPCSETQPASASSDNGRGKGARALMEARGRYPVRRAAVPTRATGERRETTQPPEQTPAPPLTPCSFRRPPAAGQATTTAYVAQRNQPAHGPTQRPPQYPGVAS